MPVSLSACSYQWHTNRTNGANREASLTSRYPLLTVRLGLAFWQFVCFDNSYVYVWISFSKRGQIHQSQCGFQGSKLQPVNGQSFCLPVILTTYQRFFLACDGELRFVGRRPTRVRPKAEDTSGEATRFLRLDRKRKPRVKSLWHRGYILTGYVNNRPEKKNHTITFRENKYLFFTSGFCLLVRA